VFFRVLGDASDKVFKSFKHFLKGTPMAQPTPAKTKVAATGAASKRHRATARAAGKAPNTGAVKDPKAAAKPATRASAPTPAQAAAPVKKATKPEKPPKPVRQKLVRDGFTMPAEDFALIAVLKVRALAAAQRETKKSELLRAGLHALAALDDPALLAALGRLTLVQQGRPKKNR
jgi:hypothetical protein